ncbi:MAG: hypothetical protein ACJ74O_10160, partial [Frankiaceae bacterium]
GRPARAARAAKAAAEAVPGPAASAPRPAPAVPPAPAPAPERSPAPTPSATGRPGRRRVTGRVSITVGYDGTGWSVEATQGGRALARRQALRPAQAEAVARALGVPALDEAVGAIVAGQRAEIEARAATLRSELATIEQELSGYGG